ncbi:hypothetical protein J437_LFUL005144 [Ladona fulva]|uniref:Uncharacterized protein n=1 Tax=Ladona fulva TaxID=123851 RepID=A0A8K0KKI2_LADFU|nr:hypothetical protein J437_LFUL005144 [Ladona fulva]
MNSYLTTYKKSYPPHSVKRPEISKPKSQYSNPLEDENPLLLPCEIAEQPDPSKYETPLQFMERALKEYPNLKYTLQQGIPSYDEIHQDKKNRGKSVYFLDYCEPGSELVSARTLRKQRIKLPELKSTKIPETIYKASYRDASNATAVGLNIKPLKLGKPQDNLPNDFQLKIATSFPTGKSEYQDTISDTGEIIIEDKLLWRQ